MTDQELADLKRDADRFRSLEANSTHGITFRPNGHHGFLLYIHGTIRDACEDASGGTLGECVDQYMRDSSKAKRIQIEPRRVSDFPRLRGKP